MSLLFLLLCGMRLWLPAGGEDKVEEQCTVARMKCAYRVGCGMALQQYMLRCGEVMSGRTQACSVPCKRALIAVTSTDEGQSLMQCKCEDDYCRLSKQRVEVCRPEVSRAVAEGTVVSCAVAQWICTADHLCSTALEYYNRFCGAMFHGRKCTPRCNNSVAILFRQEKAAKLRNCYCDGSEHFPCKRIRSSMDRLCFGKDEEGAPTATPVDGTTDMDNSLSPIHDQIHKPHRRSTGSSLSGWTSLVAAILLVLEVCT